MEDAAGVPFDVRPLLSGLGAQLAGPANVVMQLSRPAVGHGVRESRVPSGSAVRHPLKRARTTFSYLAVALLGDDVDRAAMRRAVDRQHAQVTSTAASPVRYRALDPELQLWVAACLYVGTVDVHERMHGPLPPGVADALYAHCARFGTTLQVREGMWPPDRAAFDRWWQSALGEVHVDEPVRAFLLDLVGLEHLPAPLRWALGAWSRWWTTAFLPPPFRAALGLRWSAADEAEAARRLRRLGRIEDRVPLAVRIFPFNALLWDVRRRTRRGLPLV